MASTPPRYQLTGVSTPIVDGTEAARNLDFNFGGSEYRCRMTPSILYQVWSFHFGTVRKLFPAFVLTITGMNRPSGSIVINPWAGMTGEAFLPEEDTLVVTVDGIPSPVGSVSRNDNLPYSSTWTLSLISPIPDDAVVVVTADFYRSSGQIPPATTWGVIPSTPYQSEGVPMHNGTKNFTATDGLAGLVLTIATPLPDGKELWSDAQAVFNDGMGRGIRDPRYWSGNEFNGTNSYCPLSHQSTTAFQLCGTETSTATDYLGVTVCADFTSSGSRSMYVFEGVVAHSSNSFDSQYGSPAPPTHYTFDVLTTRVGDNWRVVVNWEFTPPQWGEEWVAEGPSSGSFDVTFRNRHDATVSTAYHISSPGTPWERRTDTSLSFVFQRTVQRKTWFTGGANSSMQLYSEGFMRSNVSPKSAVPPPSYYSVPQFETNNRGVHFPVVQKVLASSRLVHVSPYYGGNDYSLDLYNSEEGTWFGVSGILFPAGKVLNLPVQDNFRTDPAFFGPPGTQHAGQHTPDYTAYDLISGWSDDFNHDFFGETVAARLDSPLYPGDWPDYTVRYVQPANPDLAPGKGVTFKVTRG
jgi:hypothetical protein